MPNHALLPDSADYWGNVTTQRPVAHIDYSSEYKQACMQLKACMALGERSARALDVCERVIVMCEGHYTAWLYRRYILCGEDSSRESLMAEIVFIRQYAVDCPKNYQLWYVYPTPAALPL